MPKGKKWLSKSKAKALPELLAQFCRCGLMMAGGLPCATQGERCQGPARTRLLQKRDDPGTGDDHSTDRDSALFGQDTDLQHPDAAGGVWCWKQTVLVFPGKLSWQIWSRVHWESWARSSRWGLEGKLQVRSDVHARERVRGRTGDQLLRT